MSETTFPSRPAVVNVGDEILLGEMANGNQRWMLETLRRRGAPASVALSLPDDPDVISHWLRALRAARHDAIFVSGGIGGTHDDRTREAVAQALDRPLVRHHECFAILESRYGDRFNEQRQRMAWLPAGAALVENPIGAPGFAVDGIYGFPGFPTMLQPMLLDVLSVLLGDERPAEWTTREERLACPEGDIAAEVERFALGLDQGKLGIYPSAQRFGREVTLRLRCAADDRDSLDGFERLVARLRRQIDAAR